MGKSTSSCFKLISCGDHDSVDRDDLQAPEVKDSGDKRKWSFRKKSARDRVLDNSIVSETSSGNKASPDAATASFQTPSNLPTPEKSSEILRTEDKTLVLKPETKLSETVVAIVPDSTTVNPNESDVIIIQAAIRGFLAKRMLSKKKNIIKLQAAVRGHIVRRHAIGSLRCIQAIIKMQALVRGRRARILLEELRSVGYEGKLDHKSGKEDQSSTPQARVEYTSLNNLLKNSFARQLLESKQSTETTNFKCDPLKSDSAWRWLERWMSASLNLSDHSLNSESSVEQKSHVFLEKSEYQSDDATSPREDSFRLMNTKLSPQDSGASSDGDENVITYEVCDRKSDSFRPSLSSLSGDVSKPNFYDNKTLNHHMIESNSVSEAKPDSFKNQSEMEYKMRTDSLNQSHVEEPETVEKNPSFITAQTKFEELCSLADSVKPVGLTNQDVEPKFSSDTVSPVTDFTPMEISPPPTSGLDIVESECGTELSISSTLDSPDRPDIGLSNNNKEGVTLETGDEYKTNHMNQTVDSSLSNSVLLERPDNIASTDIQKHNSSAKDVIPSQTNQIPEANETDVKEHVEADVRLPDPLDTPSSHTSVKPKKSSTRKSGNNRKHSASRNSSEPYLDSGVKSSSEQLSKNHKTGKRRDSTGSVKTDHDDHEPRDSSSTNSLPSYMQATESARAKAAANSSPRSSPDVLSKDFYVKKRHSLPGGSNTKQGSPRVRLPVSQSPQSANVNANGIHSPQERKWKR